MLYPSGFSFFKPAMATDVAPPGLFTTMIGWPRILLAAVGQGPGGDIRPPSRAVSDGEGDGLRRVFFLCESSDPVLR